MKSISVYNRQPFLKRNDNGMNFHSFKPSVNNIVTTTGSANDRLMNELTNYVGIGAGIFTGISMLPQLIKIIREKKAENMSYFMLVILMAGLAGWVWYGIRKQDLPIIFTNTFSFIINFMIVIFSFKYKKSKPAQQ